MITHFVTFHSVSSALLMENLAPKSANCRVAPVPRALSSSCGYAAQLMIDATHIIDFLQSNDLIEWESVYKLEEDGSFTLVTSFSE